MKDGFYYGRIREFRNGKGELIDRIEIGHYDHIRQQDIDDFFEKNYPQQFWLDERIFATFVIDIVNYDLKSDEYFQQDQFPIKTYKCEMKFICEEEKI